jgi:hypothetical protein
MFLFIWLSAECEIDVEHVMSTPQEFESGSTVEELSTWICTGECDWASSQGLVERFRFPLVAIKNPD